MDSEIYDDVKQLNMSPFAFVNELWRGGGAAPHVFEQSAEVEYSSMESPSSDD